MIILLFHIPKLLPDDGYGNMIKGGILNGTDRT